MFDILKVQKGNSFYAVKNGQVEKTEECLGFAIPHDLKTFYTEVGYKRDCGGR